MTTIRAIRERIGALCATLDTLPPPLGVPVVAYSDDDTSFTSGPIIVVRDGRGIAYQRLDEGAYLSTREMTVALYISRIEDESYSIDADSWDQAEACVEPLVDFFVSKPSLSNLDSGFVRECRVVSDSGVRTLMTRHNASNYMKWRGVVVRLRVSYVRPITEDDF